jgi:threonine dehydratase
LLDKLLENTPIEKYTICNKIVFVKREDMFGQPPAPPLAKLRGASIYLKKLIHENPDKPIGVYDTTISKAGQGIAYLCKEYGAKCWLGFPLLKGTQPAESKLTAEKLGAELYPMKAGRTQVTYYQFRNIVKENGGIMLPLGLTCKETVTETIRQVQIALANIEFSNKKRIKNIVLVTGTGTIATGISLGSYEFDKYLQVYGISCGMSIDEQWKRIRQMAYPEVIRNLILVEPEYGYYDKLDTSSCPFPTSPYYDMKAYSWLTKNIEHLDEPILFWNIGV